MQFCLASVQTLNAYPAVNCFGRPRSYHASDTRVRILYTHKACTQMTMRIHTKAVGRQEGTPTTTKK